MGFAVSSKVAIKSYNPMFLDPFTTDPDILRAHLTQAKENVVYAIALGGRKVVAFASHVASMPGTIASFVRPINDQIMPSALLLLKVARDSVADKTIRQTFLSSIELVKFSDLFETVNDIHWFVNGGCAHAFAKGRYFDILAHIFLVPTNLTGVVLYGRGINPNFMSFLGKWATGIGQLPYASAVGRFAVAPACYVTLCLAYLCMTGDSIQRGVKYYNKIDKLEATKPEYLYLPYERKICAIDGAMKKMAYKFQSKQGKQAKIEHLKAKFWNAFWDGVLSATKLAINGIALGVLLNAPLLVAIGACPPAMIALGAVALFCVGRSIYLRMQGIPSKPNIAYECKMVENK